MPDPWTFSDEITRVTGTGGAVTLVEGASFCISDSTGDIVPGGAHGLFFLDTRFLSRLELRIDGRPLESLGASIDEPFEATFLLRAQARAGSHDSGLVVMRHRWVGYGMHEHVEVRNYDITPRHVHVSVIVGADFANLFAVKEGRVQRKGAFTNDIGPASVRFGHRYDSAHREVDVAFDDPDDIDGDRASWEVTLGAGETWTSSVTVTGFVGDEPVVTRLADHEPTVTVPSARMNEWRHRVPRVDSDNPRFNAMVARAIEDLGALRLFDPVHPADPVVAAGAPWFMTLFGRDSLLTAGMALPVDVDLARGVVETLARLQGTKVDPESEEQPGKILHEVRFGHNGSMSLAGGEAYYGSVDATPLFVTLLGELRRWGLADDVVDRLKPHADRALQWIEEFGDLDGDGYVEYHRSHERSLANQGWKDSWDGIRYGDGRVAPSPLALCEVQGYVYAAYVARAHFANEAGDAATYEKYVQLAADLKTAFNRDFWLADRGWFAVALDPDKAPVDSLTSNIGHCLWSGIVDEDKAASIAKHLLSPEMFSGWGVRTLASSMGGYNPISYHCGSVWPHDNALIAAGLVRYGFVDEAHRIIEAMLDVGGYTDQRLPELFAGLDRDELAVPAAYPTSCSPQAWAAAAPLFFLRMLLRLDPWLPHKQVWIAPALPESLNWLRVRNIRLGGAIVSVEITRDSVSIDGLPSDIEVIHHPRRPITAELPDQHG